MRKKWTATLIIIGLSMLIGSNARCDLLQVVLPAVDDSPQQNQFFHRLLETALDRAGIPVNISVLPGPQLRIKHMLDTGDITLYWMVASDERNRIYLPIPVGLTEGLIGRRLFLIRKGDQHRFDGIQSLEDLQASGLVAGLGQKWFDGKVWTANGLSFREHPGNWKAIFIMLGAGRDFDYFPRGLSEIGVEADQFPQLAIEKHLVLIYDRDFYFYLSKKGPHAGATHFVQFNRALEKAREDGVIARMVEKFWGDDFERVNYDRRRKILLTTPD